MQDWSGGVELPLVLCIPAAEVRFKVNYVRIVWQSRIFVQTFLSS
jgi:hypothetical protein